MAPQISAGIELEGLFLFRKDLLEQVLPEGDSIRTTGLRDNGMPLSKSVHRSGWAIEIGPGKTIDTAGYLVHEPQKMIMLLLDESTTNSNQVITQLLREDTETGEDVTMEDEYMEDVTMEDETIEDRRQDGAFVTPSGWSIKRDISIRQLTRAEKVYRKLGPDLWDTIDIELISGVYTDISRLQEDTRSLVESLTTSRSFLYHTQECGMHIHVGFSDNSMFPIEALRILGFLCLVFEHEISRLHEPHRVQESNNSCIRSNLEQYRSESADFKDREYKYEGGTIRARTKYISVAALRKRILDSTSTGEDAYGVLKQEISRSKMHAVNFQNIDGRVGRTSRRRPPTVEFRQPEATFSHEHVGHLVRFYSALVGFALGSADRGGDVLPQIQNWDDVVDLVELLAMLDLPAETRDFLAERLGGESRLDGGSYWEMCLADGTRNDDDGYESSGDDDDDSESSGDDEGGPLPGDENIPRESDDESVD